MVVIDHEPEPEPAPQPEPDPEVIEAAPGECGVVLGLITHWPHGCGLFGLRVVTRLSESGGWRRN